MPTRLDRSVSIPDPTRTCLAPIAAETTISPSFAASSSSSPEREDNIEMASDFDWLSLQDVAVERTLKENWTSFEAALQAAAGAREPVGELLILARRITRQQLDLALQEQRKTDQRLGDVLVCHGWISEQEKEAVLAFQHNQDGVEGPLRLGNLLIAAAIITREQLADAIARQQVSHKKLGAVLVEAGYAQPGEVMRGLSLQRRLVKAALASLLSFSLLAMAPAAHAGENIRSISVGATVLPVIKLEVQQQVAQLSISRTDIERGYVDVPAASKIEVRSNSKNGFTLAFNTMVGMFQGVQVTGLGSLVELGTDGGSVAHRTNSRGPVALLLGYRFVLAKGIQPGNYAWPIALSAQPL
jgi:hypothetical protein